MPDTASITLPPESSDEGLEVRVLIAECAGPAFPSYSLDKATECMQLMDTVLWNRRGNPRPYLARGAQSLADIVKARGQFAGLGNYPTMPPQLRIRIDKAVAIANAAKDSRRQSYADFIRKAIEIAKSPDYDDPSPGTLCAWRTANSSSPGRNFLLYKSVLGNDFYYTA